MTVGVLALQGGFAEHRSVLGSLGVRSCEVRTPEDLRAVERLIIPGGESTVMLRLLRESGMGEEIVRRQREGTLPLFGTCAGAIVLSSAVADGSVEPLCLMDIAVERNSYGRQLQSFRTEIDVAGALRPVSVSFIRAPRIVKIGGAAQVLATHDGEPVLVRQGGMIAATFHAELAGDAAVHELFLAV